MAQPKPLTNAEKKASEKRWDEKVKRFEQQCKDEGTHRVRIPNKLGCVRCGGM